MLPKRKRSPMRRGLLITAVLLSAFGAACGGDDDDSSGGGNDEMVQLIMEQGETEEAAKCFADELKDFSVDELRAMIEDNEEPSDELAEALSAAGEKCAED